MKRDEAGRVGGADTGAAVTNGANIEIEKQILMIRSDNKSYRTST
jgi:hypothetical protein